MNLIDTIVNATSEYGKYLWSEITFQAEPWYQNYFWWLIILSIVVWALELLFPWRKEQSVFRRDFWLDTFYMFFNFFIFKLVFFAGLAAVSSSSFKAILGGSTEIISLFELNQLPYVAQVIIFFLVLDLVQWSVHNTLHRFEFLWRFHKVHHSVKEMGFAAHLRYHWMENVFYEPAKYLALLLIGGFEPSSVFVIYYINITIGHLNHANINLDYGPLKYILNNPRMHIWHHAKELPDGTHGVNFGISLSLWDYLFGTAHIPESGRDIELGFENDEVYPQTFTGQLKTPFTSK
ncbi:MAG: sterol desaturase family protein [Flavobacteriales bacterium]